jgi:hypothetical protein
MNSDQIAEKLNFVRSLEGENFQADETKVQEEYAHRESNRSNISLKILTVIGGFLATLAFVAVIAISGIWESQAVLTFFGFIILAGAVALNRNNQLFFLSSVSVSAYILGLIMVGFGLASLLNVGYFDAGETILELIYIVIALLTLLLVTHYMLTFLSVFLLIGALLAFFITQFGSNTIAFFVVLVCFLYAAWLLFEAKWISMQTKLAKMYDPIRDSLLILFITGLVLYQTQRFHFYPMGNPWILSIAFFILCGSLVYRIIKKLAIKELNTIIVIYFFTLLFLGILFLSPPLLGALAILLLGFYVDFKTSFVLGILTMMYFFV